MRRLAIVGPTARDRILEAGYQLFCERGIGDVGVDEIIERAGVAKATFYRAFASKTNLVVAVLDRRDEVWTRGLMVAGMRTRGDTPEQQLLAAFDLLGEWFESDDFDCCLFLRVLLEVGPRDPAGEASKQHLLVLREVAAELAREARLRDADGFAQSWHIAVKGSIIAAVEGDLDAGRRGRAIAEELIKAHRAR